MPLAAPIDLYFLALIALIRVVSWFPYRLVRIAVAFDGRLGDQELARIAKGSFLNSWLEIFGSIPNGIDVAATRHARITGWEHLQRALAAGKGVILWENSGFGRRFWMKQILSHKGVRVHQIHGAEHVNNLAVGSATATWVRRRVIRPFFDDAERPFLADMIILPSSGDLAYARELLSRLKENAVICLAADGTAGARLLAVPFLGTRQHFSSGMVSLARLSGAEILPIVCQQTDDGKACLVIEQAIQVGEDEDRERQTEQMVMHYAELMEHYIHREPAAYRNWHVSARRSDKILRN